MNSRFHSIEMENLTIAYQDTIVFDHFNLTLPASGCICFFGPSGSGKTTLLSAVAGLKKPLSGKIRAQQDGMEESRAPGSFPDIAYVFQEDRLIPWLTALENVLFVIPKKGEKPKMEQQKIEPQKNTQDMREKPDEIARHWLKKVGLLDAADKYPSQLSGGMKQRVNIARALAFDAPIILLDEPFKGLDDQIKSQIIMIFQELKKDRLILLVTHDKEDASLLADKIIPVEQPGHADQ